MIDPNDFVITRKRKKYKFAHFANLQNCFEAGEWQKPVSSEIIVELGAGTAHFSLEIARRHPEAHIVAIDVKADRLQTGARLAQAEGITNISFLRAHADQLKDLFQSSTIAQLWLTFSDPFPKSRHAKHRLTHPRFLAQYKELLAENGALHFKTDNHALFDWSLEQFITSRWSIKKLTYDLHNAAFDDDCKIMTTYEKRFTAEGLPTHYVVAISHI